MTCNYKFRYETNFKKSIGNSYKKFSGFYNEYQISFKSSVEFLDNLDHSLNRIKNDCQEVLKNGGLGAYSFLSGRVTCEDKDYGLGISCKKQFEDDKEFSSYQSFSFDPLSQDDRLVVHSTYEEAIARFETLIEA